MSVELSAQAQGEIDKGFFSPKIVIDVKGYPLICSGGDLLLDPRRQGVFTPDSYSLLDIDNSLSSISQQLKLEEGGSSSTTTYKARLIDKDEVFTRIFSFVTNNVDILENEARVYFGFEGGLFPRDFVPFINGTVGSINLGSGYVDLNIGHPDRERKQDIFQPASAALFGAIDNTSTTIAMDTIEGFLLPADGFKTFVRIDDEIIEYTGISGTTLTGVSRAAFDSVANAHDDEADIETFYEITGDSLTIALKLMLSGSGDSDTTAVKAINDDTLNNIPNAIFFDDYDIRETIGASIGDSIDLVSVSSPTNDFVGRTIIAYGTSADRSYYIVDGAPLTTELAPDATAVFRSQYDVLPDGCGIKMHQVDLPEFENIATLFASRFLPFNFYLKDSIKADEFINKKLYLPSTFYHLPRKGKNSIGVFSPPLTNLDTVRVNEDNILKNSAKKIVVKRSTGKNFANFIRYSFNEDTLETKLLSKFITLSAESTGRINARNKGIIIESEGLRRTVPNLTVMDSNADNILERYRFGAEEINVSIKYTDGIKVEIGDAVVFGTSDLQVSDTSRGDRKFNRRIMQVINRTLNLNGGGGDPVKLVLLDTTYSVYARYGIISPSSKATAVDGNKVSTVPYCNLVSDTEFSTWSNFIGTRVQIKLPDYSYVEELELTDVKADGTLCFFPAPSLPAFPVDNGFTGSLNRQYETTDLVIEALPYPLNSDVDDQAIWKDTYVHFNPELTVTGIVDDSNIQVSSADAAFIIPKAFISVHNDDFSNVSQEVTVAGVNSNIITTNVPLSYLPAIGDKIVLVGYLDGGYPYRYF